MAKKKDEEKKFGAPADQLAEEAYVEATSAPNPDAAFYVLQPTSAEIPEYMGNVPKGRFQEEVLKEEAGADAVDAHPEENQPAYGVTAEDS